MTPGTEGYRKLEKRIANVEDRLENILPKAIESAEKVKSKWGMIPELSENVVSIIEDNYMFSENTVSGEECIA